MFVEALLPIGQTFDAMSRQNRMINSMNQSNALAQAKLDQGQQRLDLKKRELDMIEEMSNNKASAIRSTIQQYGNHVQLQMPPVQPNAGAPQRDSDGKYYPTFEQVDGWSGPFGNSF